MNQMENYEQDFGILVEAGFIAVKQGDEDSAVKLFKAAQVVIEKRRFYHRLSSIWRNNQKTKNIIEIQWPQRSI